MIEIPFSIFYIILISSFGITGLIGWTKDEYSLWMIGRVIGTIGFIIISIASILLLLITHVRFT